MVLNYKHLRYFWMVAKMGSITKAATQLHLTPHSVSGQLSEFSDSLGVVLFKRVGRNLELTETGRRVLKYADQIFNAGEELLELLRDNTLSAPNVFRVGCADSISKLIACRLVEPALRLDEPVRLICREGRLDSLLADLAVHKLDLVLADRPVPPHLSVRAYNHLLGESSMTAFGCSDLISQAPDDFLQCLGSVPMLLPGEDFAIHRRLLNWLQTNDIHPNVVGEFDDSAMMKAFGQSGAGIFFAPTVISSQICKQYQVKAIAEIGEVVEQVYAITTERRMSHPASVAISTTAKESLFT